MAAASRGWSRCRSRNRGCAARPRRPSRARERVACTGGSRETRSAIARRGRLIQGVCPQKTHAILASHMRLRGSVEATAVVLGSAVLACVFTYPYIFHFTNAGRLDTNDGRWSIWVVSWVAHALTTDPRQLFTANIFYPHTNALAFSEGNIFEGVIGAPVWLLTKNPYTTHNVVFMFAFAQSFVAT